MANQIILSAASICRVFDRMNLGFEKDLPVIGKVSISLKEILFGENQIIIPVHTEIPLANKFDILLTDFSAQGTTALMRIEHIGAVPSDLIPGLSHFAESLIRRVLNKASVSVNDNQASVDFGGYLAFPFTDISITSLVIRNGIEITFDY